MTDYTRLADTTRIDFTSAGEVNATGHLLVSLLQHHGGFQYPPLTSPGLKHIQRQCAAWLSQLSRHAAMIAPHEVLQAIAYYDILHRVTTGKPGTQLVNTQIIRAFSAATDGDTRVDETELMQAIDNGRRMADPLHTSGPHNTWFVATLRKWLTQMQTSDFSISTSATPDRQLNRASIILAQSPALLPGLKEIRKEIASGYLRYCEQTLHADAPTLLAMLRFTGAILSATPALSAIPGHNRVSPLRHSLIGALSSSPPRPPGPPPPITPPHPAHRAAFTLDLAALSRAEAV